MHLTSKLLLAIVVVFGVSAAINVWILNATVDPGFAELERHHAHEDGRRIVEALRREGEHLGLTTQDYAFWDNTYAYVLGQNDDYEAENLFPQTLIDLSVNAMILLDREGKVLWRLVLDIDSGEQIALPELPEDRFAPDHPVLVQRPDDGAFHGLMQTQAGLMVVAVAPILPSASQGEPVGTFLFGRLLTPEMIARLRSQTAVDFVLLPLSGANVTEEDGEALAQADEAAPVVIEETSDELLTVRASLRDFQGNAVGLVRASIKREITQIGRETENTALALLLLAGLFILLTMGIFVRTIIIAPLSALTDRVASIGETGHLPEVSERETAERTDEIGLMEREFDAMVRQLRVTRQRLMEQSFYSGRAESAAGVLHNIRNALNPVNMALWRLTKGLEERDRANEARAIAELQDDNTPAERRAKLWQYMEACLRRSEDETRQFLEDVNEVVDQHRKVEDILVQHDSFSRYEQPADKVDLNTVISEAAKVLSADQRPSVKITWPDTMPSVKAHPILLGQVLGNLFINASEAIAAAGRHEGEIVITCVQEKSADEPEVLVTVTDNGEGILADKLEKIFERGYSSRSHKSGGLGLHWCANCLAGMGGRIAATSEGPGRGAAFHVCLPAGGDAVQEAAE